MIQGAKEFRAQLMRQQLRRKMTEEEAAGDRGPGDGGAEQGRAAAEIVDIDGLAYRQALIDELRALDLCESLPPCPAETLLFQIGPRKAPAPELEALAEKLGEKAALRVAHRPPFWARLEHEAVADVADPMVAFLAGENQDWENSEL